MWSFSVIVFFPLLFGITEWAEPVNVIVWHRSTVVKIIVDIVQKLLTSLNFCWFPDGLNFLNEYYFIVNDAAIALFKMHVVLYVSIYRS